MTHRVVITGMGAITPIGIGIDPFWKNLLNGVSGVKPLRFPHLDMDQFRSQIAAPVEALEPEKYVPMDKRTKYMGRTSLFAVIASRMALEDAGFIIDDDGKRAEVSGVDPYSVGVILGTGSGNMDILETGHRNFIEDRGPKRISPHALPQQLLSAVPANVSMYFQCRGISYAIPTACSSASQAIGNSFRQLQNGCEDIIITGGSDCCLTPLVYGSFSALRGAMSTRNDAPEKASRPFDKGRDGFVMGEGAGILVLEKLDHAIRRNARIYAEIVGFGMTSDAYHITIPHLEGEPFIRAIETALQEAGIGREEIDYINAHGTSTRLNDPIESRAIRKAFGKQADRIPINSTKSMIGHLMGAAGGVEAIATVMSIRDEKVHPTINYEVPDPECDLDYVPNTMREVPVRTALSNSLGFGGFNSVLVFRKYDG